MVDEKCTWKSHINYICNTISKGIGILIRAKNKLYGESLQLLYETLIKPYMTYCITVWGNTYNKYLKRFHLLQKKIIRILTYSEYIAHTEDLFHSRKIMTIYNMYKYFVGIFVFKSINRLLPNSLCDICIPNVISRKSITLRPGFRTKQICEFSVKITGPQIWNTLPNMIREAKTVYTFKKQLKFFLL